MLFAGVAAILMFVCPTVFMAIVNSAAGLGWRNEKLATELHIWSARALMVSRMIMVVRLRPRLSYTSFCESTLSMQRYYHNCLMEVCMPVQDPGTNARRASDCLLPQTAVPYHVINTNVVTYGSEM